MDCLIDSTAMLLVQTSKHDFEIISSYDGVPNNNEVNFTTLSSFGKYASLKWELEGFDRWSDERKHGHGCSQNSGQNHPNSHNITFFYISIFFSPLSIGLW